MIRSRRETDKSAVYCEGRSARLESMVEDLKPDDHAGQIEA